MCEASYVSHRSSQISVDSFIFQMPSKFDTNARTIGIRGLDPEVRNPLSLQIPPFSFPSGRHPSILQQTGFEKHDLRVPIVFDRVGGSEGEGARSTPFLAISQNKTVVLYDTTEGVVLQQMTPHASSIDCIRTFKPDSRENTLLAYMSESKLSIAKLH